MLNCLKCESELGLPGIFRLWTLRSARCPGCGARHSLKLPRSARLFIQVFVGTTYGFTVLAGNSIGWSFLESTGAYLCGFLPGTITLVFPFALTGRLPIELVNHDDPS
jgi:hypothetical protein